MGKVVKLAGPRARTDRAECAAATEGPASVIILPIVRIERLQHIDLPGVMMQVLKRQRRRRARK